MKIDHIGIAVASIEGSLPFYREALGLVVAHQEEVLSQKVKVAFLKDPSALGGETQVELLEPLGGDGPMAKFIQTRGPGMHHIAFQSRDIVAEMRRLKERDYPPLEDAPRPGSRGHRVCFLHPKHSHGVLVELVNL